MSTFSLKQFHTQVRRTGLAKQNRFEIEFPVPQLLQKRGIFQGRVVNLFLLKSNFFKCVNLNKSFGSEFNFCFSKEMEKIVSGLAFFTSIHL